MSKSNSAHLVAVVQMAGMLVEWMKLILSRLEITCKESYSMNARLIIASHIGEDWRQYSVEMPWYPVSDEVIKLLVLVILLDDTWGTVYFDDFELIPI